MQEALIGIEDFAAHCDVSMDGDILTVDCILNHDGQDYHLSRSVDLAPAIDYVARQMEEWHVAQHGSDPEVSGFFSFVKKAGRAVKKVATNKVVRSLYREAKPFLRAAVKELPGGESALELAKKASKVYERARAGSQEALAKVKQVKALAEAGDQKAEYAVKVMQNVSTLTKAKEAGNLTPVLPQVANAIERGHLPGFAPHRAHHSFYDLGLTMVAGDFELTDTPTDFPNDVWDPQYDIVGLSWRDAKWAVPGYAGYRAVKAIRNRGNKKKNKYGVARGRNKSRRSWAARRGAGAMAPAAVRHPSVRRPGHVAPPLGPTEPRAPHTPPPHAAEPPVPPPLAAAMTQPDFTPQTTDETPADQYHEQQMWADYYGQGPDPDYAPEEQYAEYEYYGGGGEEYYDDVQASGWFYNHPYRTSMEAVLQLQKSPGVGFAMREMYNKGLGR